LEGKAMSLTTAQVKRLLEAKKSFQFKQLALSLMYTRLKHTYEKAPTNDTVTACTSQLNDLFAKFGTSISEDYNLVASV
jgi:hypothetical protein